MGLANCIARMGNTRVAELKALNLSNQRVNYGPGNFVTLALDLS
jgi:hypothetical protein